MSVLSREVAITKKVFQALGEDGAWLAARYEKALTDNHGSCGGSLDAVEQNEELCHGAPCLSLPALRVLAHGDRRWFLMGLRVLEARDPEVCRCFVQDLVGPEATVTEQKAVAEYISSMFYCPDPALGMRLLDLGEKTISAVHDSYHHIASSVWLNARLPESQQARITLIHGNKLDSVRLEAKLAGMKRSAAESLLRELMDTSPPTSYAHMFAANALGEKLALTQATCEALLEAGLDSGKAWQVRIALKHMDLSQWPQFPTFLQTFPEGPWGVASKTRLVPLLLEAGLQPINQDSPPIVLDVPSRVQHHFEHLSPTRVGCLSVDGTAHALGHKAFDANEPGYHAAMAEGWNLILKNLDTRVDAALYKTIHDTATQGVSQAGEPFMEGHRHWSVGFAADQYSPAGLVQLKKRLTEVPYRFWIQFDEATQRFSNARRKPAECEEMADQVFADLHRDLAEARDPEQKLTVIVTYCQILEQLHLFQDGNIRTAAVLTLNLLLLQNGFGPTVLSDPNCFDILSVEELVEEVKDGQRRFSEL